MSLIPGAVILAFAVVFMWILLEVRVSEMPPSRKRVAVLFTGAAVALNVVFYLVFGRESYAQWYSLLVHLPVIVLFSLISPYRGWKVFFTFLTTFVACTIPVLLFAAVDGYRQTGMVEELLVFGVTCALMVLLAKRGFGRLFHYALRFGEPKDFALFSAIPFLYLVYSFSLQGTFAITGLQFELITRLVPLVSTLVSYFLVFYLFRNTREKQILLNEQTATDASLKQAKHELEQLRIGTEQTIAYRHDMRHHMLLIKGFVAENNTEKLVEYLADMQADLDSLTPQRLCSDEITNLILLSFADKAQRAGVTLQVRAEISSTQSLNDTEWCALLSNLLENAITACAEVRDGRVRKVSVDLATTEDKKLLILIENPHSNTILMKNGLPTTEEAGHGVGLKSIRAILEKHAGVSHYEAQDGLFTARIMV